MTEREVWRAPAKINLWLEILGRRADGYHLVDTCYQAIDLHDTLVLEPGASDGLTCAVEGDMAVGVPAGAKNLATRAARLLAERTGHDLRLSLRIVKSIPPGAGLGGGSSDAAAVLLALAGRFAVPDPARTLHDLARELGADIPFFIAGGTQRAGGIGERLQPVAPPAERWGIVVWPGVPVSTAWAYGAWDEAVGRESVSGRPSADPQSVELQPGDLPAADLSAAYISPADPPSDWLSRGNALEPVVVARRSEVRRTLDALRDGPAAVARLSGSGSAGFALYRDPESRDRDMERVQAQLRDMPAARIWSFACIDHGVQRMAEVEIE